MKIVLFSRRQLTHTTEELVALRDAVLQHGFQYAVNEEFAPLLKELAAWPIPASCCYGRTLEKQPEGTVMVCYGGDGTLLEGVHRLGENELPVLGINAGHLGFLTSAPTEGLNALFNELAEGRLKVEPRSLLSVTGNFAEEPDSRLALNEFSIQRNGAGMVSVETYVDGQMVATYHGDGVIVSTPTGSTAYALSAGGPVVAPSCTCLVIAPLAPHNLTMRPVVVPDTSHIQLRVRTRHAEAFATLDNRSYGASDGAEFEIKRAEKPIFLAVPHNISFYDALRNKMMWGVDLRG
ncbi:MAG: NAD(+)/NADH kinase [Alistipes sp.]|nr:NAD(+)/NADH kinase [Alistipes sp.]